MKPAVYLALLIVFVFVVVGVHRSAAAADPDGVVDWTGITHHPWQDRRPLCPIGGEPFQVRLQTWQNDLTAVRVRLDDGGVSWVTANVAETRGPYHVWVAQIPATASGAPSYLFELTDGPDVDYLSVGGLSDGFPADGGFVLDMTTLLHAPVGATPTSDGGAVFKVWAPTRTTAHVRGDFNGWGLGNPMTQVGEYFVGKVATAADRAQYKYFFNSGINNVWNTDPRGRSLNPGGNLNAHLEDPFRYSWQIEDFTTPRFEDLVVYQLHLGTFSGRNDPVGATSFPSGYADAALRVGHLVDLGINAVLLNPMTEFPGDLSGGYNPQSQWSPEWIYGTPDDFKFMVDTFHQNGIAVLIDIVWNHFTVSDNFMWNYDGSQIYFDSPHVDTPWGAQADFDAPEVQDYFVHSAHLWLEEYKVDGFRMDATDFMTVFPQESAGWALMQRLNDEVDRRWANKIVIAEQLPDDAGITQPTASGGAGFDSQYHDAFTDRLREELFDSLSGNSEMWKIGNIVNGSGPNISNVRAVNYLELHDEAWPSSGGQRLAKSLDASFPHDHPDAQARIKMTQGVTLFAPGIPAFLMGAEWLEDADFGADTGNRIDWSKKTTYAPFYLFMKDAVALRRNNPALEADQSHTVFHLNDFGNVIAFERTDGNESLVILANFQNTDYSTYRIGLPDSGDWEEILNSQDAIYGGSGIVNPGSLTPDPVAADGFAQSIQLNVPASSILVLRNTGNVVAVPEDPGGGGNTLLQRVFPNPASDRVTVSFRLEEERQVRLSVFDLRGRRVAVLEDGVLPPGEHRVVWGGSTTGGDTARPGIYFVRLAAGDRVQVRKVTLIP